jgi:nicotinate-nucleotide adenylyltransferase
MSDPRNIAFFGGTFDPIHEGHLEVAQKAVDDLKLDQLIFIPCRRSPHKNEQPGASDQDRLKMLQLATSKLAWAVVDDYELKKPPPSYTWETVEYFKARFDFPARLFLLIGSDQWEALPRWKNIDSLAQNVEFIVVGRGEQVQERQGFRAHFIQGDHPASASQIRAEIGQSRTPSWLAAPVKHYISKKALYSPTP